MNKINIVHLYPNEMNIYGDNGNILILTKRLKLRNIGVNLIRVGVNDKLPNNTHIILGGGGQDTGQQIIADDLYKKSSVLEDMAKNNVMMLMICGMYQMFGHYFKTQNGEMIKGIGIIDAYTEAEKGRLIGNITVKTKWGELIGYENHSGRTYLQEKSIPLGSTDKGMGNNGKDKTEGAIYNNVFGTYLHGPVLAKAPEFSDYILSLAIKSAGMSSELFAIDDKLEHFAGDVAKSRPR